MLWDTPTDALAFSWFWWMGMVFAIARGRDRQSFWRLRVKTLRMAWSWRAWDWGCPASAGSMAIGPRFTRAAPHPAEDVARTELYIRTGPTVAVSSVTGMLVIVLVTMVAAPRGTSPELLPVLAALAVFPIPIAAALLYSGHLHRNRERLYANWLGRR